MTTEQTSTQQPTIQNANTIKNITVLGAGVLGAQIAFQAAYSEFEVTSYDLNDDAITAAEKRFARLSKIYANNLPDASEHRLIETNDRITTSTDLAEAVANADLIIEAIPEHLDLKISVWEEVGKHAPSHTIFTTNTSTLLPSMYSSASGDESRFLALHFANDIWKIRVVEVMGTEQTNQQAIDTTYNFAKEMGMLPVIVQKEQRGYIMNSLLVPFLESACMLYAKEVATPIDVDKVWKLATGAPMGPFEIMDVVGLRTVYAIHSAKAKKTGDPLTQKFAETLKNEFLAKGKNGKESRSGFYQYDEQGQIVSS